MSGNDFIVLMREKPGVAFYAWCHGSKASCTADARTAALRAAAKHAAKMLSTRAITEAEIKIVRETGSQIDVRFPAEAMGKGAK